MSKKEAKTVSITIRLDTHSCKQINRLAREKSRDELFKVTPNNIITKIVKGYLKDYEDAYGLILDNDISD